MLKASTSFPMNRPVQKYNRLPQYGLDESQIVKRHVPIVDNFGGERKSAIATLIGVDWTTIAPGALETNSETVKAVTRLTPSSEEITFSSDVVSLSEAPLKPASAGAPESIRSLKIIKDDLL